MSAVGVFFLLLALSVVGYVALWLTRRKLSGRHFAADKETWNAFLADVSDHAAIAKEYALRYGGFAARQLHAVARAAYEKARELAGGGGASPPRRTTRATGGSSRARVSESMTAPLASSAAHMGSLTDGALPALAEPHEGGGVRVLAGGGGAAATFAPPEPAEAGGDGAVAPLIAAPLPASSPAMGGPLSGGGVVAATTAPLSFGGGEPLQVASIDATDDNLFAEPVLTEPLSLNGGDAPLQVASVVPLPPGAGGGDN
ncbi:hypothetical protein EMIHUDRAFT_442843 [Emiliania huxleyi CCMP1516]|uniref:Cathepsin propeptide inhibitor domain-containing protein n=2 Tax=Emiliania huxleyi TaxID=2903 RepID=A0A0D3JZM1_EMIH1|nr:hypothetical protein EMIHUDRAFT_442843 [Emiliania huxleyi CCMP1516]EOD28956.1 hypothetical protein EMIHUDRAFT_442843 [Emiliania huxleyi CCMP1516]|eukprot:XP_005781385.1 hypothetical protein EMIHUDRAFT_442843 [Emiliania huxleyi CCMP1516]